MAELWQVSTVVVVMTFNKVCRLRHEHWTFLPKCQEGSAIVEKKYKPFCLICNAALLNHKSRALWHHYDTNRWSFSQKFPTFSELRKYRCNSVRSGTRRNSKEWGVEDGSVIWRNCRIPAAGVGGKVFLDDLARQKLLSIFRLKGCCCTLVSAMRAMN